MNYKEFSAIRGWLDGVLAAVQTIWSGNLHRSQNNEKFSVFLTLITTIKISFNPEMVKKPCELVHKLC